MPSGGGLARPAEGRGRAAIGWFLTTRYRYRGLRWAAAAGAAVCVLLVLGSAGSERPGTGLDEAGSGPAGRSASRLPEGTRGVVVDAAWDGFETGDAVDVHAASTGQRVVAEAEVVYSSGGEAVIAVRPDQVAAVIGAVAGGGVTLVLAPRPTPP